MCASDHGCTSEHICSLSTPLTVNVLDDHSNNNNLKIEWKDYEKQNPNLHVFIIKL